MRVFLARVTGGVIVPETNDGLRDGMVVSVLATDETSFTASPEEEAELREALADQSEPIPAEQVLARLHDR